MQFSSIVAADIATVVAGAIVVGIFEDGVLPSEAQRVDGMLDGAIAAMRASGEFKAKVGDATILQALGRAPWSRIVLTGLGSRAAFSAEAARRAAGEAGKCLARLNVSTVAFPVLHGGSLSVSEGCRALVEGLLLRAYRFNQYFSEARPPYPVQQVVLVAPANEDLAPATTIAVAMAAGANYARDLANEPPNVLFPQELAARAQTLAAEKGLTCEVFDEQELRRRRMEALLAVGQGSEHGPRLIVLQYRHPAGDGKPTLGIVGKGITFDTGGISLKPGADMHLMKTDMGGAAAMLGAMYTIADLQPALNVTLIVASAENMPDGRAFRPGDILRAMNGKTIEIQNTDAEGRLVLADALSYAVEQRLAPIVDAATLTGACSVALGPFYSGCFSNDAATRDAVLAAASSAGERLWPLPLDNDFRPLLDSSCADMRNVGGREGGAILAAMFLQEFVASQPWAHLDIAPTAFADNETAYFAKGLATGHPARTVAQLALDLAAGR